MANYQLSCGHWLSDPDHYEIGGIFPCPDHGRAEVLGSAHPPIFRVSRVEHLPNAG